MVAGLVIVGFGTSAPELVVSIGAVLILSLTAYLFWTYRQEIRENDAAAAVHRAEADEIQVLPATTWSTIAFLAGGLIALVAGSQLTLVGALGVGETLGVPEAVMGLTVIAVGTSLPEFAVSVLATLRGHYDVAIGNILGSNIFNVLGILGLSAVLQPLPVGGRILNIDQWVMLGAAVLLIIFLVTGRRLSRYEGGFLLGAYIVYTALMYSLIPD